MYDQGVKITRSRESPQNIVFQGSRMIIDGYDFDSLLLYDMDTEEYILPNDPWFTKEVREGNKELTESW